MLQNKMSYQVLARKYRPKTLSSLRGQDFLVKTLSHAILQERVAHAFLLSGIRGIGKTTTARIIAITLNCTSPKTENSIPQPCWACENCLSFANESHPDIIEIDAASKTSVNDVREVIENSNYSPILGKYKIFIIDEIHMLSNHAFNALLKILEEPPTHVKFIFATTEANKIPLTVISRCQFFELKRFTHQQLSDNLRAICELESINIEPAALHLIASHSDGSMRDGLSLLEKIALSIEDKQVINAEAVKEILGAADLSHIYQLLHHIINGQTSDALSLLNLLYQQGAEPLKLIEQLMSVTSIISKALVITDFFKHNNYFSDSEQILITGIATQIDKRQLSVLWQMFLKGFDEVTKASNDLAALEMLIIRISCLADLPMPIELLSNDTPSSNNKTSSNPLSMMEKYSNFLNIFSRNREMVLYYQLKTELYLINFEEGKVTARLHPELPKDFVNHLTNKLKQWTGESWQIIIDNTQEGMSLQQHLDNLKQQKRSALEQSEIMVDVMQSFPGATITSIKNKQEDQI